MVRSRSILPFLLGLALVLVLGACGSDESGESDATATSSVDAAPPDDEGKDLEDNDEEAPEEVGTFTVTGYRASFVGSAGYAEGVLKYQGQTRKFRVSGLGAGGFGVSKTNASGTVYNMNSIDDFTGGYVQARSGVTLGNENLGGGRWVRNENGVKLLVHARSKGLQLNLGADGMVITWDN